MKIENPGMPITDKEVAQLEEQIGCRLPDEYRTFMLKNNGGRPNKSIFKYKEANTLCGSTIKMFFSIGKGEHTIEKARRIYEGRIPDIVLPIASDSFGNIVCIGLQGRNRGKMYFWDHELELMRWNLNPIICTDFKDFLKRLEAPKKEPITEYERMFVDGSIDELKAKINMGMPLDGGKPQRGVVLAIIHNRADMLDILLSRGARKEGLLSLAAEYGRADIIEMLIRKYNIHPDTIESLQLCEDASSTYYSVPPLSLAVSSRKVESVRTLLRLGANSRAKDVNGNSVRFWTTIGEMDVDMGDIIKLLDEADSKR